MERDKWKQAFEQMNPSEEKKEELWERVIAQANTRRNKKGIKYTAAVILILLAAAVTGMGINAATNGALASVVRQSLIGEWLGLASSEEIVDKADDLASEGTDLYAPEILYVDEEFVMFGNLRGILIYNRKQDKIVGTIDTQRIDCMYFDGGKMQTCVVKEDDHVRIFNEKEGVQQGDLYSYSLSDAGKTESVVKKGQKPEMYEHYYAFWKSERKQYTDTFRRFSADTRMAFLFDVRADEPYTAYSEKSKKWEDKKGRTRITFLSVVNETYWLYTFLPEADQWEKQELHLQKTGVHKKKEKERLPEFVYTGKDPYIEPILSYFRKPDPDDPVSGETVWIPEFMIVEEIVNEGEVCVFGCFGSTNYRQTKMVLEARGGAGTNPACVHLKATPEGYKVDRVDQPRDGAFYCDDIKKFTKGHPGLYKKMMDVIRSDKKKKQAREKYLKMYIKHNKLDIRYYKDSGWDAVKIPE